jgi:hypothetical protein
MKSTIFILCFFLSLSLSAQEKKTIIIKKTETVTKSTDESGKESSKKEVKEIRTIDGDASIEEMEKELLSGKKDGEFLTINKEIKDGKEATVYTLTTKKDGQVEVMKWDGEGDMPKAIKDKMANIDINENIDGDNMEITIDANNVNKKEQGPKKIEKRIIVKDNESKVKLGVMINDSKNGVKVDDIVKDGASEKAGIKVGDVIVKINDTYIFSSEILIETMQSFNVGDKADLLVLRAGKEKKITIKF